MTDRLATLMHGEIETLDVPAPPAAEILGAGRRLRRRRRASRVLAAGAAVVAVAGVGFGLTRQSEPSTFQPVAPHGRLTEGAGAISVGSTIFLDDGRRHAQLPEPSAGVFYTSAGVLVRTSETGNTETSAPYRFTLVGPRGQTDQLDLTLGSGGLDTDPSQPYLVRTEVHDGSVDVVVHDVATDRDVARIALPGHPTWRDHSATPPVSLDGDTVYVATAGTAYAVQWRTGTVTPNHVIGTEFGPVRGGRAVDTVGRKLVDVHTGKTLLDFSAHGPRSAGLSPDGRYLTVFPAPQEGTYVYDVATGHRVLLRGLTATSWTPDGHVFAQTMHGTRTTLDLCDASTGHCVRHAFPALRRIANQSPNGVETIVGGQWFQ